MVIRYEITYRVIDQPTWLDFLSVSLSALAVIIALIDLVHTIRAERRIEARSVAPSRIDPALAPA